MFAIVFKLNILCKVCLEKRRKCPEIGILGHIVFIVLLVLKTLSPKDLVTVVVMRHLTYIIVADKQQMNNQFLMSAKMKLHVYNFQPIKMAL